MFFRSKEEAYFLAGYAGQPVDKKGRPVSFFAGTLVYGLKNRYEKYLRLIEKAALILTGLIVAGAYVFGRMPVLGLAIALMVGLICLTYIVLKIVGRIPPKEKQIVAEDVSYVDFMVKCFGYKSLFGPLGTSKSFFGNTSVSIFFFGLAFVFFYESTPTTRAFGMGAIFFGSLFFVGGLIFYIASVLGDLFYRKSSNLPDDLQLLSPELKKSVKDNA